MKCLLGYVRVLYIYILHTVQPLAPNPVILLKNEPCLLCIVCQLFLSTVPLLFSPHRCNLYFEEEIFGLTILERLPKVQRYNLPVYRGAVPLSVQSTQGNTQLSTMLTLTVICDRITRQLTRFNPDLH